jgi:hypothetical protein
MIVLKIKVTQKIYNLKKIEFRSQLKKDLFKKRVADD